MDAYLISKIRNRYIVPFEFNIEENTFEEICQKIDAYRDDPYSLLKSESGREKKRWLRKSLRSGEQDLYDYIVQEFSVPGDIDYSAGIEKSGCYWNYESFEKEPFELLFSFSKKHENTDPFYIALVDMGLYLFRSGIGFLWYEMDINDKKINDSAKLIRFQNMIKELNRRYNNHLWIDLSKFAVRDEFRESCFAPFMLGSWIAERLAFLNVSYQAERNNSYAGLLGDHYFAKLEKTKKKQKLNELYSLLPLKCPDKALSFLYVVFKKSEHWQVNTSVIQTAYYLANGYKESYEMSPAIADVVQYPFANVLWMASREGCGYFAWQDERNKTFFTRNQYTKIMNDYFLLYIKAIYQSFSLMKYAVYTSKFLPNDVNVYLQVAKDTEKISEQISKIGTEINLFLVKSIATSVSHVQHQNNFYNYLCQQLKIKEDVISVTEGLESLNDLQQESVQKKQRLNDIIARKEQEKIEQREKEADNTFQIGLGLMTFLAGISAVTDAYGIISSLATNTLSKPWMIAFGVLFTICIGILIASIVIFIKSIRNLRGK